MSTATKGRFAYRAFTVDSTNKVLRYTIDSGGGAGTYSATLTEATYYIRADGVTTSGIGDLLTEIETQMNADTGTHGVTFTVSFAATTGSDAGKVRFTSSGANPDFALEWDDGSNTFDETWLGFTSGVEVGSNNNIADSQNQAMGVWFPDIEGLLIDYDVGYTVSVQESDGYVVDARFVAERELLTVTFEHVYRNRIKDQYSNPNVDFQTFWASAAKGNRFFYWPDVADTGTVHSLARTTSTRWNRLHEVAEPMLDAGGEYYRVTLECQEYIAAT